MILGERLRLRAVEKEDIDRFVTWLNDPEVREGVAIFLPLSKHEEEKWFETTMAKPATEHPFVIEINDDGSWKPIGDCGFFEIDWRNRFGEIGIFIGEKQYWNQGYGSEAVRMLLKHGFNTLNLNRVFLRVFEDNPRAIHAYEKVGFIHEGRLRKAEYRNGRYIDILLMSVLREEWNNSR
ncbi:MAG: GNAT family N-acetyltransferase [Chloroflexi bacterium]|nr:GNAT family N-acetyltransferase [Chloroflexota bacterium]